MLNTVEVLPSCAPAVPQLACYNIVILQIFLLIYYRSSSLFWRVLTPFFPSLWFQCRSRTLLLAGNKIYYCRLVPLGLFSQDPKKHFWDTAKNKFCVNIVCLSVSVYLSMSNCHNVFIFVAHIGSNFMRSDIGKKL